MRLDDLDYHLPEELIASEPLERRDASRLLVVGKDALLHETFHNLPKLVEPSLFVFNDTRVIPARLLGTKSSGGKFEILLLEAVRSEAGRETWRAFGKASKGLRVGEKLTVEPLTITVLDKEEDGSLLIEIESDAPVMRVLESIGQMPLPPYMKREAKTADRERYQTVYAAHDGSVAAPTAGLHFSPELMDRMRDAGHDLAFVTLHVGAGTFKPVKADALDEHKMHEERYIVPESAAQAIVRAKSAGRPVVAIGTTVVRTLEAVAQKYGEVRSGQGSTDLFIRPPFDFRVIDGLITNFHLPRSTLLALVMAFAGVDRIRNAYTTAVNERYRFFSYGDAMLLSRETP